MTEFGPLPMEWRVVRLGVVASLVAKKSREIRINDCETYRLVTVKLYAKGVVLRSVTRGDKIGTKILYKVEEGDFVFSKIDLRNGAWGFVPLELAGALVSGDFPIIRIDQTAVWQDYLTYYLSQPYTWEPFRAVSVGTTGRRRARPDAVMTLPIPLPPLPEQRAIAHVLRTVQRAKEATEGVIAALRELKKSLMQHLFTYGTVPVGAKNFSPQRETELGPLPKEWRVVRLGEVAEKPQYGFTAAAQRDPVGPKMLRITDIQDGNVNWNAVPYCECGIEDIPKYLLEAGDILFARTGSVGKAFLVSSVPEPSIFASYLIRVRVDRAKLDPQFAFLFMQSSAYWSQITSQTHGAVQPNVNATQLRSLLLPLPPLDEQREIARILQAVDVKIAAEQARRAALEEVFKTLLHQLMTGQIRVSNITGAQQSGDPATGIGPFPQSED